LSKAALARGWRTAIPLEEGRQLARQMVEKLEPWCRPGFIVIAGSIRRERPAVNDIDIVAIPSDPWHLLETIRGAGNVGAAGPKIQTVIFEGVTYDIYLATPASWATILLLRTGSAANNIRLASIAKRKGWHLAASGDGLFDKKGERIAGDTEDSIYRALGVPYQQPKERN
jgi:DNA polymerase (family 10)